MASEIRVNQIQNRSGLGTVTFSDTGVIISGVTTISDLRTSGGALTVGTGASISSPATNVLALGTNNTEKVRIDSSGNFNLVNTAGIMTAFKYETPALINNHFKSQSTTAGAYVRMYAAASSGQWDIYGNGANLRFSDNASSGNIQMDRPLSMNSQNIIMSSGYGIDFSATSDSSGTMTSELLSDYEEGTWTPAITGSTSGTVNSGARVGTYTKIGRLVTARFTFINPSATTISGTWRLTGIPFSGRASSEYVGGYVHYNRNINKAGDWLSIFQESSSGITYFRVMGNYMNGTETYDISGNWPADVLFAGTIFYEAV
jgi:hypothetical protein